MKKRVLEGIFVPGTFLVKHEAFFALLVTEDHLVIKHIDVPHEWHGQEGCVYFLKVFDVNSVTNDSSEQSGLVENYLFSMREQFSMEGEVFNCCHFTGK